jgi:hypothetical protein
MRRWLFDGAKILAKLAKANPDDLAEIKHEYCKIYDQCLWEIITANEPQLNEVFKEPWAYDLPAPIHTIICQ